MGVWLIVAVLLALIMGFPYLLYLDGQKLEQPVVQFEARAWRTVPFLISLLGFMGLLLVLAGVWATRPASGPLAWLGAFALTLISLSLSFVMLRLYSTYWRHDRHATLIIYQQEHRAEYRNEDVLVSFALADVVRITWYTPSSRALYDYHVFALRDGTEVLLTCLMYNILGPEELLLDVPRQKVRKSGAWLPGDELNFPTLF